MKQTKRQIMTAEVARAIASNYIYNKTEEQEELETILVRIEGSAKNGFLSALLWERLSPSVEKELIRLGYKVKNPRKSGADGEVSFR